MQLEFCEPAMVSQAARMLDDNSTTRGQINLISVLRLLTEGETSRILSADFTCVIILMMVAFGGNTN